MLKLDNESILSSATQATMKVTLRWSISSMSDISADTALSVDSLCHALETLDEADTIQGAEYRLQAQELLANPSVTVRIKTAIADLLMQANQRFVLKTVRSEESY